MLFLDELPEFPRAVLDVLREPLESGHIDIARAARQTRFPAKFQLIAAMNPCPCGHLGDPKGQCRCTPDQISRYQGRLSGPFLDRIDLHVTVPRADEAALLGPQNTSGEHTHTVRDRVIAARHRQVTRQGKANTELAASELERHATLDAACQELLKQAITRLGLSARGLHRVIKVARTIADLEGDQAVSTSALSEALRYRAPKSE